MIKNCLLPCFLLVLLCSFQASTQSWIRINLAGYKPQSVKVAVWGSKENTSLDRFQVIDSKSGKVVSEHAAGSPYGAYGPFVQTYRLDFSTFKKAGTYTLRARQCRFARVQD